MDEKCELCGEPMPKGEKMFKFHGYSGPCPKPPLVAPVATEPSGMSSDLIDQANAICDTVKAAHGVWLGVSRIALILKDLQVEPVNEAGTRTGS